MRVFIGVFLVSLFFLPVVAFAADLKVKVVDPQSAAVAGAQVSLLSKSKEIPLKVSSSSAEGLVTFGDVPAGTYQIEVLAPGFSPQTVTVNEGQEQVVTVQLRLGVATETVVVSATRTPVPAEETGASISTLESG